MLDVSLPMGWLEDLLPDYGNFGGDHTPGFVTGSVVPDPDQLADLMADGVLAGTLADVNSPVNQLDQAFYDHDFNRTYANQQNDALGVIAADLQLAADAIAAIFAGPDAVTNPQSPLPAPLDTIYGYAYAVGSAVVVGLGGAVLTAVGEVVETGVEIAGAALAGIGDLAHGVYTGLADFAGDVFGGAADAIGGFFGDLGSFGADVFGGLSGFAGDVFGGIGDAVGGFLDGVGAFFGGLFGGGGSDGGGGSASGGASGGGGGGSSSSFHEDELLRDSEDA